MPRLYDELADWWPLLSDPAEYAIEAAFYERVLRQACSHQPCTLLELGSGGGNNASYMKRNLELTLVDLSPGMLRVSQLLNAECEHRQGDMRTIRLGREFDAVFIQDAICYMTTLEELRAAVETAYVHCRPGGAALFAPDHIRENFEPATECGGHDVGGRGMRYMAWMHDPDPSDTTYMVDYAYLMRREDGSLRVEHDRHVEGLFSREQWLDTLVDVGFEAASVPFEHPEVPPGKHEVFVGTR